MNYKDLDIWKIANEVAYEIHVMTLEELPQYEMHETGSQIRRSSKSIRANIAEGFGRRRSKKEFLQFLRYAQASKDETRDHLESLWATGSLKNRTRFEEIAKKIDRLGIKLHFFIKSVEKIHRT